MASEIVDKEKECRPCVVVLTRLSEADIQKYSCGLETPDQNFQRDNWAKKKHLRERRKREDLFKKYREQFHRKKRKALKLQFGDDENSYEEFESQYPGSSKQKKKRKKKYEQDFDWSPTEHKTSKIKFYFPPNRMLRQNSRRKVIESDSSSEEEFQTNFDDPSLEEGIQQNQETYSAKNPDLSFSSAIPLQNEPSEVNSKCSGEHEDENLLNHVVANKSDVVSGIMQEMDKLKTRNLNMNKTKKTFLSSFGNSSQRKSKKRKFNITHSKHSLNDLPSSSVYKFNNKKHKVLTPEQTVMNYMLDRICPVEKNILEQNNKDNKCKWCDTPFNSKVENEVLCVICKDRGIAPNDIMHHSLSPRKKFKKIGNCKNVGNSKTMEKVFKKLSKYEQQRLMYNRVEKCSKKNYHCKSSTEHQNSKENVPKSTDSRNFKNAKSKTKNVVSSNKKVSKMLEASNIVKDLKNNERNASVCKVADKYQNDCVSFTNINDGLFLMTFPEPDKELDFSVNQESVSNSKKAESVVTAGLCSNVTSEANTAFKNKSESLNNTSEVSVKNINYVLPPVPTVVVANYAPGDSNSFYLSSVYYQNEMTQSESSRSLLNGAGYKKINANMVGASMPTMETLTSFPLDNSSILTACQKTLNSFSNSNINLSMLCAPTKNNEILNSVTVTSQSFPATKLSIAQNNVNLIDTSLSQIHQSTDLVASCTSGEMLNYTDDLHIKISHISSGENVDNCEINRHEDNSPLNIQPENDKRKQLENVQNVVPSDLVKHKTSQKKKFLLSDLTELMKSSINLDYQNKSSDLLYEQTCHELEAVSILAVLDLDGGDIAHSLKLRLENQRNDLEKLISSQADDDIIIQRVSALKCLLMAKHLLSTFRSFSGVSKHYSWKEDALKLTELKKEKFSEDEERPSCQFAQNSSVQKETAETNYIESAYHVADGLTELNDAAPNIANTSYIEKIQSQVSSLNESFPISETAAASSLQNYSSALYPQVPVVTDASTPITPLITDSRETPSRGSGPRTPARPESAMSQPEDNILTPIQIKKENLDSNALISHTTTKEPVLPQSSHEALNGCISNQIISASSPVSSAVVRNSQMNSISSVNHQIPSNSHVVGHQNRPVSFNQNAVHLQNKIPPPNRTVPFNSDQLLSKYLSTVARQQFPNTVSSSVNTMRQNILNVQQVFIPNGTNLPQQRFAHPVPSNQNQYIIQQASVPTSVTAGGAVLINNAPVGPSLYPVGTTINNQVTVPNPTQLYYTASSHQISSAVNQTSSSCFATQNKQQMIDESEMFCAVCKKIAKLRCKQCAKVAYCDTACARIYWQKKHKMECRPTEC